MWVLWFAACEGERERPRPPAGEAEPGPRIVGGPAIVRSPSLPLAAELEVTTDVPSTLRVSISGGEWVRTLDFAEVSAAHRVPLVGFRAQSLYTVEVEVRDAEGRAVRSGPLPFETGPLPATVPDFSVLALDAQRTEPGYTLMVAFSEYDAWILALDPGLGLSYAASVPLGTFAVTPLGTGELAMVDGFGLRIADLLGRTRRRWIEQPTEPVDVAVPFADFHHDLQPQPDGSVFALTYELVDVPAYPQSYELPQQEGPATVRNDMVVHLADDGTVLGRWDMLSLLDIHRIGFNSLDLSPAGGLDWVHSNALLYDADTDEITVSLRHQDAVVRFSAQTGELRWILGAPEGWSPTFEPYLLRQTEPFVWPTHQHGIEYGPDGTLRMFDNGNNARDTPYRDSGQEGYFSRVLELSIDARAMTVTPSGDYRRSSTGALYASALGNADLLPETGDRLGTFGTWGRIVEWTPAGAVVLDVATEGEDWRIDRALRVPSLYGADVLERWERE